jgi:hypothetical protein
VGISRLFRAKDKSCGYGPAITGSSSFAPSTTSLKFAVSAIAVKPIVDAGSSGDYPLP